MSAAQVSAGERRVLLLAYAAVVAASVVFVAPIVLAPWLRAAGHPWIAGVLYAGYGSTCHQLPDRSYWLLGAPLAVCSRCASIYAGVLLGLVIAPARGLRAPMPRRRWLLASAAPAFADFLLGWLGLVENSFLSRGLTGVALGAVSAFYILPGLMEAIASLLGPKPTHGEAHGTEHEKARDH